MLDATGWKILRALQENARTTYAELAKQVNLTAPAVAERVRKMEEAGIITGYHAGINLEALGYAMLVFIQLAVSYEKEKRLIEFMHNQPEVLECYNLTGQDAFIIKAALSSVAQLDDLLGRLAQFGQTTTHIVLSNTIPHRVIGTDLAKNSKLNVQPLKRDKK